MKTKRLNRSLSYILCIVLIAAVALFATGCTDNKAEKSTADAPAVTTVENGSTVGEGETQFTLTIADKDGNETQVEVLTDKTTVGDALLELGLISGDEGEYGLYVKTVNGITADYDTDGVYWAFYVNGEYAMSGVDTTEIVPGDSYALKVE